MKSVVNIVRWFAVIWFGVMALAAVSSGAILGAVLFVLGGILLAPIGAITELRKKLKLGKTLTIVLAIVFMFVGAFTFPTSEEPKDTDQPDIVLDDESEEDEKDSSKDESESEPTGTQVASCSHTDTTVKNKTDANCTQEGYTGDTYCASCDELIQSGTKTNAIGHNTEIRNQKSATTTSEGYTGDTYCKTCGLKVASGETISKIVNNTPQNTVSKTVYTTATGKRYHSTKNCSGLSNANAIYDSTLQDAQNQGLTPCAKCY